MACPEDKIGKHLSFSSQPTMAKDSSMDINVPAFLESARISATRGSVSITCIHTSEKPQVRK